MPSKIKRRSGIAVAQFCEQMGWQPDWVFHVGIGMNHEEIAVFQEQWPDVGFAGCEPHPDIVKSIQGRYPGEIFQVAIRDTNGRRTLHTKSRHKDGSSISPHSNRNLRNKYDQIPVDVIKLDDIKGQFGKKMLLWLDCEGSEYAALCGGWEFVRNVEVINVEMSCRPFGDGWCSPADVHRILGKMGFAVAWTHTNRIHARQFDAIYVRREMLRADLCMFPGEID